jgi:hypothetical protein
MDGLALLEQAKEGGLKVAVEDGQLRIKGPRKYAPLSRLLIENKAEVIAAFELVLAADLGTKTQPLDDGTGTETPGKPTSGGVLGPSTSLTQSTEGAPRHRLIDNGFAARPVAAVPVAIQAAPKSVCRVCGFARVLPELRTMTGGRCYSCWEQEVQS